MAIVGERVYYLNPKSLGTNKLDERWGTGIWCGVLEETGEYLIGTSQGIVKARTFRRMSADNDRWNLEALQSMKGTPWEPCPGTDETLKPKIALGPEPEIPKTVEPPSEEPE